MQDPALSLGEKQQHALSIGRAFLGVENSYVNRYERADGGLEGLDSVGDAAAQILSGTTGDDGTTVTVRLPATHEDEIGECADRYRDAAISTVWD